MVHERLWHLKYIVLLLLFGVSLQSIGEAVRYAEIEPFQDGGDAAFSARMGLPRLCVGAAVDCGRQPQVLLQYLCPLGAARRFLHACGCSTGCAAARSAANPARSVRSSARSGRSARSARSMPMNATTAWDCQVTYWNDDKCPPLSQQRRRREQAGHGAAAGGCRASCVDTGRCRCG